MEHSALFVWAILATGMILIIVKSHPHTNSGVILSTRPLKDIFYFPESDRISSDDHIKTRMLFGTGHLLQWELYHSSTDYIE